MSAELPSAHPAVPFERVGAMVSLLTHDVRNGLNSMELQAAYITDLLRAPEPGVEPGAELKRLREMIADQGRTLQRFAARFRIGKADPMSYPARLFVQDFRERLGRQQPAFAPHIVWTEELGEEDIAVDAEMAFGALGEIFLNAEHFREAGAPVAAHATAQSGRWILEVRERHATVGSAPETWGCEPLVSTRRGGCGLGLFHARRLLAAQGGSVEFAHDAAAARLTTRIFLPLAR